MPTRSLIDSLNISSAGGVAGRRGYRYQDHVAAAIFLDMLYSPDIHQIECETADDIVARKKIDGISIIEYIQVKTTESDFKWSLSELKERTKIKGAGKPGSSLIEKSLACDRFGDTAHFRFVSTRDVRAELQLFKVDRAKRGPIAKEYDALVKRFENVYKSFKSKGKNNIEYWARNMLWQVEASEDSLRNKNINRILDLADRDGALTPHSHAQIVYARLLCAVGDAADAIAATDPDAKAITRKEAYDWWNDQLGDMRRSYRGTVKVYQVTTQAFFTALHRIEEQSAFRQLDAYDVAFDFGKWRSQELIDYLLNWLPEVVLPARVLADNYGHIEARTLIKRSIRERERHAQISDARLLAELMMHAIMRHYLDSEPIACRLFSFSGATSVPTSAHIVQSAAGDELWLSRAHLTLANDHNSIVSAAIGEMKKTLLTDYLREERDIIIQLREPQHMRATNLERIFDRYGKLQDLLKAIRLPLLIAYDSNIIASGYRHDYVDDLIAEVTASYEQIKPQLNPELQTLQVNIFLIPVEDVSHLVANFGASLRRN
ncbi:HamA C-terminal domain-containing protein [Methylobacterium symbioticum]|uniref:DUF4297 domain-containing protein n=1 Tax=Methylobacterium symbioticum TaxID=2584084 RepID=A0A509E7A7_9HYPH|nr:dsDNA nuclease domain-containing protein [Methylobacterium symbioticum]VUD70040.1 hypothetical protein MET9862_00601 [Methylobacterium symbioticum]